MIEEGRQIAAAQIAVFVDGRREHGTTVFPDAEKFDVSRAKARRHMSFGFGVHRCVGARLAELQLKVLLEEMHKRRMRVKVTGDVQRVRANFVHGFRKLEVTLEKF